MVVQGGMTTEGEGECLHRLVEGVGGGAGVRGEDGGQDGAEEALSSFQ